MKRILILGITGCFAFAGQAHSIALHEDFNGDYSANFPYILELDHLAPLDNFRPLFTDSNGVARAWWKLKDSSASEDSFIGSHSAYNPAGTSNDWLVSRAIDIPTQGYTLTFGAQSYVMRQGDRLSDLEIFILDNPIDEKNLPDTPTWKIEKVSEGESPDAIEKDFVNYSFSLDEYAGKTIYIAFANRNTDKDILVIDNVLVQRLDKAEMSASSLRYVEAGDFNVSVEVKASSDTPVTGWSLTFDPGNGKPTETFTGAEVLEKDIPLNVSFSSEIEADATAEWTVTLNADGMNPISAGGTVTGMKFTPVRRMLLEESTGVWCGNCPLGMYAMENIALSDELGESVVPVSVHISGGSAPDYMVNEEYSYLFGVNSAPALRINRSPEVIYFSIEHDGGAALDINNPLSIANKVNRLLEEVSLVDVALETSYVTEGNDTTAVAAKVTLRPAVTLDGNRYAIGFILTESNVGLNHRYWNQQNYFSGLGLASGLGGFVELDDNIEGWRYNDVARQAYGYRGYEFEYVPVMEMDKEYTYEAVLPIPDTYSEQERNGNVTVVSPSVVASNLALVAYVIDKNNNNRIENCIERTLSDSFVRPTIAEQVSRIKNSGVEGIDADKDTEPEYYTLQGIRVCNPEAGIYIVKKGNKVYKKTVR